MILLGQVNEGVEIGADVIRTAAEQQQWAVVMLIVVMGTFAICGVLWFWKVYIPAAHAREQRAAADEVRRQERHERDAELVAVMRKTMEDYGRDQQRVAEVVGIILDSVQGLQQSHEHLQHQHDDEKLGAKFSTVRTNLMLVALINAARHYVNSTLDNADEMDAATRRLLVEVDVILKGGTEPKA